MIAAVNFRIGDRSMRDVFRFSTALVFVLSLFLIDHIFAAARVDPLTVGYSNITATYAPFWVAVEEHIGARTKVTENTRKTKNPEREAKACWMEN
jgi:hypothetical protein